MVVLLLGGTGTLGTAFVKRYADVYTIVAISRNAPAYPQDKVDYIQADIIQDRGKIITTVLKKYGNIDAVIFNAVRYDLGDLINKDSSIFTEELDVAFVAPLTIANTLLRDSWMREEAENNLKNNKNILFVTSGSGLGLIPNAGQATYSTIKSGLHMLTKHMSMEYAQYGVRVNAVAPGSLRDIPTLDTTVEEIKNCLDIPSIQGQIRAVDGNNVSVL